ncbi:MAG: hypothetical protein AAGE86_13855, partial [Pseudomonadota bacterium]
MSSDAAPLPALGSTLVMSDGSLKTVTAEIVEALAAGSRLLVVGGGDAGDVMFIAPEEAEAADLAVSRAVESFSALSRVDDAAILKFFELAAARLRDDTVWQTICDANAADVERALAKGRTVGRLRVNDKARQAMIDGLDE